MRILSSAEKLRRVCRRMSLTTRSAGISDGDFALEDLGFVIVTKERMRPESSLHHHLKSVPLALTKTPYHPLTD